MHTYLVSEPGDFNLDNVVDATDIDLLFDAIDVSSSNTAFDVDGSESVDLGDIDYLVQNIFRTNYGDANLDGLVDGVDFGIWMTNKFQIGEYSWSQGNFNGADAVDGSDFNIWNENRFLTLAAAEASVGRVPRSPLRVASVLVPPTLVVKETDHVATNDAVMEFRQPSQLERITAVTPQLAIVDLPRFAEHRMESSNSLPPQLALPGLIAVEQVQLVRKAPPKRGS